MSSLSRVLRSVRSITKSPYEIVLVSWRELIQLDKDGKLNMKACYQRGDASPVHWKSKFIGGLLHMDMPTVIALRKMPDGSYELMDGLQRATSVIKFMKNLIKTPLMENGLHYTVNHRGVTHRIGNKSRAEIESTLDGKALIESVLDSKVICVEYKNLTDDEASQIFVKLNDNTDLNPAEKINGIQGAVTTLARLLARGLDETGIYQSNKRLKMFDWVRVKPGRLVHDDFIYRCMLMEMWKLNPNAKEGIFYDCCDVVNTRNMATGSLRVPESAENLKKIEKAIRRRCDKVILSWIELSGMAKKPIHTNSLWDLLTLYQLTHVMEHKFGKDYKFNPTFAANLFVALIYLSNKKEPANKAKARFDGDKTLLESIKSSTRPELVAKKLQLILDRIGNTGITVVDSKRTFETGEIYCQWIAQNKKCAVTGLPLAFEDAVGGHRDAHADGNPTDAFTNLVVIHKSVNAKMGSRSYDEYMTVHYPQVKKQPKVAANKFIQRPLSATL